MGKQYKLLTIILLLGSVAFISYKCANNDNTPKNEVQWQEKYPHIFNNVGKYKSESSQDHPYTNSPKVSEYQQNLAGTVTNQFGIRDDILEYIINHVPKDNDLALRAAIKYAHNEQLIYYGNLTQKEAVKLAGEEMLAGSCLANYLSIDKSIKLTREMDKLFRNTKARDDYIWDVDNKVFGYQYLSTGLSVADETEACKRGEF